MAEKTDEFSAADKPALTTDQRSKVSSQPDSSTGKVIKKRTAVSPVQNEQEQKRRRASLDVQPSSKGGKKLTKLQKEPQGELEKDVSEPKTKGKHLMGTETKGRQDSEAVEKKTNLQNTAKDFKDGVAQELKRLATTDGFWSFKPTSRSNRQIVMTDHIEGPLPQKTAVASLQGGRNSTPGISSSSAKSRMILKQQKKELEGEKLDKRSKTTDGFWSSSTLPLRPQTVNPRNGSPSSASLSLDRVSKLIKPIVPLNEDVNFGTLAKQENEAMKGKLVKTASLDQTLSASPLNNTGTELSNLGITSSAADAKRLLKVPKPAPQSSSLLTKEPWKAGRTTMKGWRGKPPGMPMTEEEKTKIRNKAEAKRAKNEDISKSPIDSQVPHRSSRRVQQVMAMIKSWTESEVHDWLKSHHFDLGITSSAADAKRLLNVPKPTPQSSSLLTEEPLKAGRTTMKGRRGKPPGMPMTEEEKTKIRNKAEAKRAKNEDSSKSPTDSQVPHRSSRRVQQVISKIKSWTKSEVHDWLKSHHFDKIPNLANLDGEGIQSLALQYMHNCELFYTWVRRNHELSIFQSWVILLGMKELTDI